MPKILVVDRDQVIQSLYKEEFTEEGFEVYCTGNCHAFMEMVGKIGPDVILLEIDLPSRNGLDLLQEIRKSYYDMPVIVCTAYGSFRYDPKVIAADYFVEKSWNLDELKVKVRMALESRFPFQAAGNG